MRGKQALRQTQLQLLTQFAGHRGVTSIAVWIFFLGGKKKKRPGSLINTGGEDNYRTGEECVLSALIGGGTEQTLCSSNGILIIRSLSADQLKSGFTFPSFPICLFRPIVLLGASI
ncbi:unnamed protein product [Boreogadus saida]